MILLNITIYYNTSLPAPLCLFTTKFKCGKAFGFLKTICYVILFFVITMLKPQNKPIYIAWFNRIYQHDVLKLTWTKAVTVWSTHTKQKRFNNVSTM